MNDDMSENDSFASIQGPETKPVSGSRRSALIFTIVVLAVLVIGIVIIINRPGNLNQNDIAPTPTITSTPILAEPTADWLTYRDSEVPFEFKYPKEAKVVTSEDTDFDLGLTIVSVKKITDLSEEETLGYDKATAQKDVEEVSKGNFGETIDFPYEESKRITKVGNLNIKDFLVLGRFDVCSVSFEHFFVFYTNSYQVIAKLLVYEDQGKVDAAEYLVEDEANCGGDLVWKEQAEFFEDLEAGTAPAKIQGWYDAGNLMIETIKPE